MGLGGSLQVQYVPFHGGSGSFNGELARRRRWMVRKEEWEVIGESKFRRYGFSCNDERRGL